MDLLVGLKCSSLTASLASSLLFLFTPLISSPLTLITNSGSGLCSSSLALHTRSMFSLLHLRMPWQPCQARPEAQPVSQEWHPPWHLQQQLSSLHKHGSCSQTDPG